ncbi:DUF6175 family protein [Flagellimonas myxillae]|uniref:DUF6175 family protein n=1 Tax=Flagellimonas myxillae TaxID=2942214 RepID=UPI00201F0256|nr:DUF6175 family protein [Muricauda myxillae]MCL6265060.1 DUF6175 family protein [Muricauda myxillae]
MKKTIIIMVSVLLSLGAHAQDKKSDRIILPSIMILPGKKAFKNLNDNKIPFNLKVGMAAVNDAFKNFGFDTKDFEAAYNQLLRTGKLKDCDRCEPLELLFDQAVADVLVELEMEYVETPHGNKVTVIVEAYHYSSSTSWASEVCESRYIRSPDISALTKNAINMVNYADKKGNDLSYIDHFMLEIVDYLDRCVEFGSIANIEFTIDSAADCDMNCKIPEADNARLKYVIEDWLEANAKDGYYRIQTSTANQLTVDEFRYECNMRTSRIERKLTRFFDDLGLDFEIKTGRSSIFVKIL